MVQQVSTDYLARKLYPVGNPGAAFVGMALGGPFSGRLFGHVVGANAAVIIDMELVYHNRDVAKERIVGAYRWDFDVRLWCWFDAV